MDTGKAVQRGKSTAIQAYLKKQEKAQINNLTLHLKKLGKKQQMKPQVSRRKEIIKIRAEINEKEFKKMIQNFQLKWRQQVDTLCFLAQPKEGHQQI